MQAHCVSAWGHDFRPDYKQIGNVKVLSFPTRNSTHLAQALAILPTRHELIKLKTSPWCPLSQASKFPGTPLMALTATATDKVKQDVMQILRISNCPVFTVCQHAVLTTGSWACSPCNAENLSIGHNQTLHSK
jgi:bloom syndrome protein